MAAIDLVLPAWDERNLYGVRVSCGPERALVAGLAVRAASDAIVRALLAARGLQFRETVGESFEKMGFETLVSSPTEFLAGASGRPWVPRGEIRPFGAAAPGTVRIVTEFRASALSIGSRLETETRVQAVDDAARVAFGTYWRMVGPFSSLIRRRWLRRAAERALGE